MGWGLGRCRAELGIKEEDPCTNLLSGRSAPLNLLHGQHWAPRSLERNRSCFGTGPGVDLLLNSSFTAEAHDNVCHGWASCSPTDKTTSQLPGEIERKTKNYRKPLGNDHQAPTTSPLVTHQWCQPSARLAGQPTHPHRKIHSTLSIPTLLHISFQCASALALSDAAAATQCQQRQPHT